MKRLTGTRKEESAEVEEMLGCKWMLALVGGQLWDPSRSGHQGPLVSQCNKEGRAGERRERMNEVGHREDIGDETKTLRRRLC